MTQEMTLANQDEKPDKVGLYNPTNQREMSEVQSALVIAKRFPRDTVASMERITNSCQRESLAQVATYQYARGGTNITGPSIRLAECIAQQWGNLQYGIRELEQAGGESIVESFAWDTETNTRASKVFKIPHLRFTKKGVIKLEDSRDIYELVANQGARRLRACLLSVIPGDVVEDALKQCDATLRAKVKVTPDLIKRMVEEFEGIGVTRSQLEKKIQRRVDAITPAQVVNLSNIRNSIRDGMSKASDWFDAEGGELDQKKNEKGKTLKEVFAKEKSDEHEPQREAAGPERESELL